ncbi:MAG: hypothetical protein MUE93_02165 [Ignavibacteriaceae bacterium]|jgi:hypothetical protein|nr:hypothetical protein [Ignavibacteriaceae bacterium]
MKTLSFLTIIIFLSFLSSQSFSQEEDSSVSTEWTISAETDLYFTDPFVFLPILIADKGNLHLEARYNYEDLKTVSAWIGYNFSGGDDFEYFITPMVGSAFGRTNGIAPGLEFTFGFIGFELYSESEYLFDFESSENNFFYNWTDLTFSPLDWLWFGISGQLTKVYETELETDRGLILGAEYQNFEFTGYYYNAFTEDDFFMLALTTDF